MLFRYPNNDPADNRRIDSEPLSVLADLQEFGLPGQELPLPVLPGPSSKRFSDASMILPPLNEEEAYLDFGVLPPSSNMSSPVTPGTFQVRPLGQYTHMCV